MAYLKKVWCCDECDEEYDYRDEAEECCAHDCESIPASTMPADLIDSLAAAYYSDLILSYELAGQGRLFNSTPYL